MKKCFPQENLDEILCVSKHPNPKSLFVSIENSLRGSQRIKCEKCLNQSNQGNAKELNKVIEEIFQRMELFYESLQEIVICRLKFIEQFYNKISILKSSIVQKFDQILNLTENWKIILNQQMEQKSQFSLYQEMDNLILDKSQNNKRLKQDIFCINKIDESIISKIDESYLEIKEKIKIDNFMEELRNIIPQSTYIIKSQSQSHLYEKQLSEEFTYNIQKQKIQCNLIKDIQQQEICYAMAFNNTQTIFAAGYLNHIKIWEFKNGQLINTQIKLKEQSDINVATCITFSKMDNILFCGSYNGSINIWKEINQCYWEKRSSSNFHQGLITCLIVNNKENQIITTSSDQFIVVWNLDKSQTITLSQTLKKHQKTVFSISLNESETQLVSSSLDGQIIIWEKKSNLSNLNYEFKYVIQKSTFQIGYKVLFINDNLILCQQKKKGISHVFLQENGRFIEQPQLQIVLDNSENEDGQFLFPFIYNKEKQIIIQKFNNSIFIIKHNGNQKFEQVAKIDCSTNETYGCMTNDAKYLIYWNFQFRMYELIYG